MEKIYRVQFMQHTNHMRDTVSSKNKEIGDMKYIKIGNESFLVRESELEKYREYGDGYRSIEFVGNMII